MSRPNLQVSFSGGRTSAYMCFKLMEHCRDEYNMAFTFANTGEEHADTLRFADAVDRHLGLGLVWLEAKVNEGRVASTHQVVSYETASRHGEPFERVVQKYGLPSSSFKHCTRELKANVMSSYAESLWGTDYQIAIGIRADERRRVSPSATSQRIIYPLVDRWPTRKEDVLWHFEQFDWDLRIPEHLGNCVTCFQKSAPKLNTIYRTEPERFDFFLKLEDLYSDVGPNYVPGPRKIFRGFQSTRDLLQGFRQAGDTSRMFREEDSGTCSESCEVYETSLQMEFDFMST